MATRKPTESAGGQAPAPVPEPTHGGVYELVDGQLVAIEGGPPKSEPAAHAPAIAATAGEGA
jgi:hypothetical protein